MKILIILKKCIHRSSMQDTSSHHRQKQNVARSVLPSVHTKRSQSPVFRLKSNTGVSQATHAYSTKSPCSSNPRRPPAPHTGTATFACLPVALASSECWTRPWYRAPTYHAFLPVWSHAALPCSSLLLPPSLRLNLILAAAKHFHQNLSDWRGAVSWHTSCSSPV